MNRNKQSFWSGLSPREEGLRKQPFGTTGMKGESREREKQALFYSILKLIFLN
jgi:hypothetical protein